ncbi:D-amino acid dehydrogenase [Spartinivicinus ruber]|uniref:D-amino acid dehydrogenase n=1 Tax=Spartinivicinus ruber TaxID=2683272 RepID=UPI0013CFE334|nr:D-amino acid dehydrogenase [Spartinivicinus ruber]
MKVVVLGCGVIGISTAYYLAKQGHQVTVVDRQPGPALETSFANAGQISPGYAAPWAAPGIPLKAVRWMLQSHSPLVIHPKLDSLFWRWLWQMLSNCNNQHYATNKARMVRLATYSKQCLITLRKELDLCYEGRSLGTLQLFRTAKQLRAIEKDIKVLEQYQVPYECLDVAGCVKAEPALSYQQHKIVGGLRLPQDETGDCYLFSQALLKQATQLGVSFLFNKKILGINATTSEVKNLVLEDGVIEGDCYIVALGAFSPALLTWLDIKLPIYPVKGYSLTIPIENSEMAPCSTVMDETYKVAMTRFDQRLRVGGTAELAGFDLSLQESRRKTLAHVVSDLFPKAGNVTEGEFWSGLRPMTPDGTPVVGPTPLNNLYLNTGHGTLGWTMCCGSAKLLADQIMGNTPEIDPEGLAICRYSK